MKKLPQNLRRKDRLVRGAGGFTGRCKFSARRNLIDRCKRGAMGEAGWGGGAGESSTISLKNRSYFNLWPHQK
jgi:hypothetical protein